MHVFQFDIYEYTRCSRVVINEQINVKNRGWEFEHFVLPPRKTKTKGLCFSFIEISRMLSVSKFINFSLKYDLFCHRVIAIYKEQPRQKEKLIKPNLKTKQKNISLDIYIILRTFTRCFQGSITFIFSQCGSMSVTANNKINRPREV